MPPLRVFSRAAIILPCVLLATSGSAIAMTGVSTANHQTTGSASTGAFGQKVKAQVAMCKAMTPSDGKHGIGDCVSDFVTTHNPGARHESPTSQRSSDSSTVAGSTGAFGQKVKAQVAMCKAMTPSDGKHGIGDCVSDFVTTHNLGASRRPSP
jgi:hypothetical protein